MTYNKCSFVLRAHTAKFICLLVLGATSFVVDASAQQAQRAQSAARPVARLVSAYSVPTTRVVETERQRVARRATDAVTANVTRRTINATTSAATMERRVFDMLNAERRRNNLSPLVWDESLAQMARLHSDDMGGRNYFSHDSPDGDHTSDRARQSGVTGWRALGENIAFNQGFEDPAAFAVERWMQSSKHRDNILNRGFSHTGLGVVQTADGRVYFTQVFVTR